MDYPRQETDAKRLDRNWNELLQELRVTQTGVQVLTGFLLTLPFQAQFMTLSDGQRRLYLVLVVLSALTVGLLVSPVSMHRLLFRRREKDRIVAWAHYAAMVGLGLLCLVVSGIVLFVFDVVIGMPAGMVAGGAAFVVIVLVWFVVPLLVARAADREDGAAEE